MSKTILVFFVIMLITITAAFQDEIRNIILPPAVNTVSSSLIKGNNPQRPLRIMTYNIHRGIGIDDRLDLDRLVKVIKEEDPDIVGLQEVERFSPRTGFADQVEYLSKKLNMHFTFGKSLNIIFGEYGNAVLSKYPIINSEVLELPSKEEKRTVLRAAIIIDGHILNVFNTHLGLSSEIRSTQLDKLIECISPESGESILMGDFNTTDNELEKLKPIFKDSGSIHREAATLNDKTHGKRIDYIFLPGAFKEQDYRIIKSEASDHYAVMSTIVIPN